MLLRLVDGEQVMVRTRAHYRAVVPAVVNLLVTITLMSFLLGYLGRGSQPAFIQHYSYIGVFVIWSVGLLSLIFGTLKPLLSWLNRFTFLTTHRIVQKNLIGAAQPTVVPLGLLSEVQLDQSRMQAMTGAGDLILIHGAYGQHQRTRLRDMPDAERLHTLVAQELGEYRRKVAAQYPALSPYEPQYGDSPDQSFSGGYGGRF
ncbi:PH domain-containing protein [Nesterenkonia flava]|uniref:PH domain-containing protein n=1 Tax=Nesterenkonia flava TaxID=469799 RepID=A0ABU1FRU9_9MICC|nr:PH domain-containing protein [Nesterenkonia flava]MDR5710876.1 PH domain-containing protein [Nesterenkonia flava]